jgi:hypothetical protein
VGVDTTVDFTLVVNLSPRKGKKFFNYQAIGAKMDVVQIKTQCTERMFLMINSCVIVTDAMDRVQPACQEQWKMCKKKNE